MPAIPTPPAGYKAPTEKDFVGGFTGALKGISPEWAKSNLSPPVASAVPVLKTVAEAVAGVDFNGIAGALDGGRLTQADIAAISGAIGALATGALDVVSGLVDASTKTAIAGAADAIPVLGTIVTGIVGNIVLGLQADELRQEAAEHVEQVLNQNLHQMCQGLVEQFKPYPTGPNATMTPADFFRRTAFAYAAWKKQPRNNEAAYLPLDGAAMYVMLCGGESQGFGIDRPTYQTLLKQARAQNPKLGNGIPQDVQRQMWKLIQGIMSGVSDPISSKPIGDQGLSLMPVLQDLAREYYIRVWEKDGPGWDVMLAQLLSDQVTRNYRMNYHEDEEQFGGAGVIYRESTCAGQQYGAGRHVDLSQVLLASVIGYQADLLATFYDQGTGKWKIGKPIASPYDVGSGRPKSFLNIPPGKSKMVAESIAVATGEKSLGGNQNKGTSKGGSGALILIPLFLGGGYLLLRRR